MSLPALRYLEKFESANGLVSCVFPGDDYEYEPEQGYRRTDAGVLGDYAHDFLGGSPWLKEPGSEAVRFTIWGSSAGNVDSTYDSLVGECREIGLGKLFLLDSAGTRRWCWAKLGERPTYEVGIDQYFHAPVSLRFVRYSDWLSTSLQTGSVDLDATPKTFSITNPGNARVRGAAALLFTIAGTFTNPILKNVTLDQQVASSRDGSAAAHVLKVDCERESVEWSTDTGASYADDYANVTLPATQVALLELAPGENDFEYTDGGAPAGTLNYQFYPAWH
jgi:hypothetical protein